MKKAQLPFQYSNSNRAMYGRLFFWEVTDARQEELSAERLK